MLKDPTNCDDAFRSSNGSVAVGNGKKLVVTNFSSLSRQSVSSRFPQSISLGDIDCFIECEITSHYVCACYLIINRTP